MAVLYTLVIYPITQIIEFTFMLFLNVFKSPSAAIVGVSLAVSFLCLPLYIVAEHWADVERNITTAISSDVAHIKKAFRGDEQYMLLSTLYKENHYHPLMSLRSSFGLLIQIPFFIAAYSFLSHCASLSGVRFFFIKDLGKPDSAFLLGAFRINILPITMTLINLVSGAIYTKDHSLREKLQVYIMALIFLVVLYESPAALVLYWTCNNIFSLLKNIFMKLHRPLRVLYCVVAVAILLLDGFLLFKHNGPVHKRAILAIGASLILFIPLVLLLAKFLLRTILAPLLQNKTTCHAIFIFSSISMALLMGLVIPTLVIKSSVVEFTNIDSWESSLHFLVISTLQSFGLFGFWALCVYFLFSRKIQVFLALALACLLFISLADAFLFKVDYPTLSRVMTFASSLPKVKPSVAALNLLSIVAICVIALFLIGIAKKSGGVTLLTLVAAIFCAELILCIVNVIQINNDEVLLFEQTKATQDDDAVLQEESATLQDESSAQSIDVLTTRKAKKRAIYHFSKMSKNVVLLMIDRAESAYLEPIFEAYPEIAANYDGFTYYKNTASFNQGTLLAAPALFGGYEYTPLAMNARPTEPLVKKHNEALMLLPVLFQESGYDVTVCDLSWANYQWIPDLSIFNGTGIAAHNTELLFRDEWITAHPDVVQKNITSTQLERNLLWFSLFKISPLVLRDSLYNDGRWWSSKRASSDIMEFLSAYSALQAMATATDFDGTGDAFFSIVNDTAHSNLMLDAPDYTPEATFTESDDATPKPRPVMTMTQKAISNFKGIGVNVAALREVGEFLRTLQQGGCYDNTRIVIVSDHGIGSLDGEKLTFKGSGTTAIERREYLCDHNHPLLLVKDFNQRGALTVNQDFMTNADVPAILTSDVIKHPANPFTGNPVTKIDSTTKQAHGVVLTQNWRPGANGVNTFTIPQDDLFDIQKNVLDYNNWTQTSSDAAK